MQVQQHQQRESLPKRARALPIKRAFHPNDCVGEEEDFVHVEVYFPVNASLMLQLSVSSRNWQWLTEIYLHPTLEDNNVCPQVLLDLSDPGLRFPSLEKFSSQNQPIHRVRLNHVNCPRLRSIHIQFPVVPIELFEIALPHTLEELNLGYCVVHDGRGLALSSDVQTNPGLRVFTKFATTVFYNGIN
jgi:hypothetical protein